MYVGPYAICVLNWNWSLTQDHFLITHWSQRTHRCSARVVGLEEYSLGLVSRYSTVSSGTLTWREWGLWFTQSFIQTQITENIKAPRHWPLCGEFNGDRWILRTNGHLRGKCFHLMTSSWQKKEQTMCKMRCMHLFSKVLCSKIRSHTCTDKQNTEI